MQIKIDKEFKNIFDLFEDVDKNTYIELEKAILKDGLREPIVLWHDTIIDGHHRYDICQRNKKKPEFVTVDLDTREDVIKWIRNNQFAKRNLTKEQLNILVGQEYLVAKQEHGGQLPKKGVPETGTPFSQEKTDEKIAKKYNIGKSKVRDNAKLVNNLDIIDELDPGYKKNYAQGKAKATINEVDLLAKQPAIKAKKIIDKVKKEAISITAAIREVVNEETEELDLKPSDKKYSVIYADPPWSYNATLPPKYGDVRFHYKVMSDEDIYNMPVKDMTDKNCVLFLWVTSPKLPEGIELIKRWGFEYKTSFVWDKIKHNMGYYNSVRHELLLVAGKGSSTPTMHKKKLYDSVVSIERSDKHSEKPEYFRKLIEELYPNTQKIELFARKNTEGWDTFGNEVEGDE